MKFEFVRNLKGGEILAKEIMASDGTVLLKPGVEITKLYINKLKENFVYYIFIEDDSQINVQVDSKIIELKNEVLSEMPFIFNNLLSCTKDNFNVTLRKIDDLIEYIIDEDSLNTNLYEISQYDNYTYIHSIDTGIMATHLGKSFNMSKNDLKRLGTSAMLHDIGKTKINESILNKTGKLTPGEFEEINKHTIYGYEILKNAGIRDDNILSGVFQHHERIDGSGYPLGTKGDKISFFAKIIAVCDVFTAISSNRTYRHRFNPNEAYEYILSGINTLFDEQVVENFIKTFSIYPLGCRVILSNGMEGYVIKQNDNFPDRPIVRVTYHDNEKNHNSIYEIDLLKSTSLVIQSVVQ